MIRTGGVPAVVGPLLVLALVLAGCSNLSGTKKDQVDEWSKSASISSIEGQIAADLSYLSQSERSKNLTAVKTNCEGFPGDVEALYETLPTPDVALTNAFNDATQAWFAAASACAAANSFHSGSYQRFLREMKTGDQAYAKANRRLASFGVG